MALVDYSDSSESEGEPALKNVKLASQRENALPALPPHFRDLYSSTVRPSTQDDPSLHGGRKRVMPHVAGNWPTHVYLDWSPTPSEYRLLQQLIHHAQAIPHCKAQVHSLLENDLGVRQPLHVSLSRPLSLKTDHKDQFLAQLSSRISVTDVTAFDVGPVDLTWHSNEDGSRWFLVLRLHRPSGNELQKLLRTCNGLAGQYSQPLLYDRETRTPTSTSPHDAPADSVDAFHVSIAWTLQLQTGGPALGPIHVDVPAAMLAEINTLSMKFTVVKVRVGQDVNLIQLRHPRIM